MIEKETRNWGMEGRIFQSIDLELTGVKGGMLEKKGSRQKRWGTFDGQGDGRSLTKFAQFPIGL